MARGFQPSLLNKTQLAAARSHFKSIVCKWRTQKLNVVFGYLNALTYRACRTAGVLKMVRRAKGEKKGFHRVVGDIKAIALKGISRFNVSIEGVVEQLAVFWGLKISEASLRKYRYELRDVFGLFKFESQPLSYHLGRKDDPNNRRPPALLDFNLQLACILLEVLEEVLIKDRGRELEDFPGLAAMPQLIYNAVFNGVAVYRRKRLTEDHAVIFQGNTVVRVSEIDWADNELKTERARLLWFGGEVSLIPDETGNVPELIIE